MRVFLTLSNKHMLSAWMLLCIVHCAPFIYSFIEMLFVTKHDVIGLYFFSYVYVQKRTLTNEHRLSLEFMQQSTYEHTNTLKNTFITRIMTLY